jgi:hypothetical protein
VWTYEAVGRKVRKRVPVSTAVVASVLALAGVLATVAANQYLARQDRLRKDFAEALAAVERYAELPYRVRRRQTSDAETRERLSDTVHEVQQDLLFHRSWYGCRTPTSLIPTTRWSARQGGRPAKP